MEEEWLSWLLEMLDFGERVRFCKLTDFNLFFLSVAEMSRNEPIIFLSMINLLRLRLADTNATF